MPTTVTLTFLPASEPPNNNRVVLVLVDRGFDSFFTQISKRHSLWRRVKVRADLPKPEECVE